MAAEHGEGISGTTRVVLQCRHRFFREGLASLLADEDAIDVVASAVTVEELLELCASEAPDVVLVDLDGCDEPAELAEELDRRWSGARAVALCGELRLARDAHRAGFVSVVTVTDGARGVLRALLSDDVVIDLDAPAPVAQNLLTRREVEVLGLIGEGLTTWQISQELGISRKTVENHKQRIFMKLDVQNQAHAVSVAVRRGFIDLDPDRTVSTVAR